MPEEMIDYGRDAADAGSARDHRRRRAAPRTCPACSPSVTPLPVIGVPVPLAYLDGMDSLLSIVQMPAGVPVATVSIGGARNAGLLAARILGAGEGEEAARIRAAMVDFQVELREAATGQGPRPARTATRGPASPRSLRRRPPAGAAGTRSAGRCP